MLSTVPLPPRRFDPYRELLPGPLAAELDDLARRLRGARVLHVNSTSRGGGVAELLRGTVPLLRDLGLAAEWAVLEAPDGFFDVTKKVHNALQGAAQGPSEEEWALVERVSRDAAASLDARDWDVVVVHDPQPAALPAFARHAARTAWSWRCHIDTSRPNARCRDRLARWLHRYDATVYTLPQYAMDGVAQAPLAVPPGIDPFSEKNGPLAEGEAARTVASFGPDPARPLATQVSRFDPWKDPLGVLEAWRVARKRVPGLQLALVGDTADDDPEGAGVLRQVARAAEGEPDVHVIADRASDRAVNAFQRHSAVVVQKSLREGFGLTVSEALWKGTPVVGGRAGGIPLQVEDGRTGFLVDSPREAGERIAELASAPERGRAMGRAGHDAVRSRFLLPRMLRDDMRLWARLVEGRRGIGRGRASGRELGSGRERLAEGAGGPASEPVGA